MKYKYNLENVEPIDHSHEFPWWVYLFCIEYYQNHVVKNEKDISGYISLYYELIRGSGYGKESETSLFYKRMFEQYGKQSLELLKFNIRYCEIQLMRDSLKKKNKKQIDDNYENYTE